MAIRFFLLNSFFALLFALLGFNLYHLQIEQGSSYVEQAQARAAAIEQLSLRRGRIFFTDKNDTSISVAENRDEPVVYAVPKEIEDAKEAAGFLAPHLGISMTDLETAFANKESLFKLLADPASPELVKLVADAPKGIYVGEKQYRFYPYDHLGAQLLGFVGLNASTDHPKGLYGIERDFDTSLAAGENVTLSIDRAVQTEAEAALAHLMETYGATGGTIIVEEPKTGRIITLASKPDFDPNRYAASPVANFLNPAFARIYEPGSVMKPFTMAAGIDAGVITSSTTYVDEGFVTRNGRTIHNYNNEKFGRISMTNVIEHSVNTGSVFAVEQLGREKFLDYTERFGFGARSGIGASDEVAGSLENLTKPDTKAINLATASFGQGTAVTPIQLVNAFAALANGGVRMTPTLLADAKPSSVERVVSAKTADDVLRMMESAVVANKIAVIPGYRVAGKTGTALIPDFVHGGYSDELIHTFVGVAPVSNPRFVVLVKIDKPQVGELAGLTVVPTFRDLTEFLLTYYRVPPDNITTPR